MPEPIADTYLSLLGLVKIRLLDDWAKRQFVCLCARSLAHADGRRSLRFPGQGRRLGRICAGPAAFFRAPRAACLTAGMLSRMLQSIAARHAPRAIARLVRRT